jgi:hypothetical protein
VSPTHESGPSGRRVIDVRVRPLRRTHRATWSPWVPVLAIAFFCVIRLLLDPWLNASSDRKLTAALVILGLPLLFAGYALYRTIVPRPPG